MILLQAFALPSINFGSDLQLVLIIGLAGALGASGLYFLSTFNKLHPKMKFMVLAKTGIFFKDYRVYAAKIVSEMDLWSMILGRVPAGFHIRRFTYESVGGKKVYIARYVEGRLFPHPMNFGNTSFTCYRCNKCGFSSMTIRNYIQHNGKVICPTNYPNELQAIEYVTPTADTTRKDIHVEEFGSENMPKEWQVAINEKRKSGCTGIMVEEQVVLDNVWLHALKFSPDLEQRFIYLIKGGTDAERVPLKEWITVYDIGKEVVSDMTQGIRETEELISKHNPLMTVIIATIPMAFILVAFGFVIYITVIAQQNAQSESVRALMSVAQIVQENIRELAILKGVNVTSGG